MDVLFVFGCILYVLENLAYRRTLLISTMVGIKYCCSTLYCTCFRCPLLIACRWLQKEDDYSTRIS